MLAKSIFLALSGDSFAAAGPLLVAIRNADYNVSIFSQEITEMVLDKYIPAAFGYPFDFVIATNCKLPDTKMIVKDNPLYSCYVVRVASPINKDNLLDFDYGIYVRDNIQKQSRCIVEDILKQENHFGGYDGSV